MELTREEAIKKYRKQWDWYAWNPGKSKVEYPEFQKVGGIPLKRCYLCEFTRFSCKNCPVEWPKTHDAGDSYTNISCMNSYYGEWEKAIAPEERSRLAVLIRDLPERVEPKAEKEELKPDFEIGDWVRALNSGCSFSSYKEFFELNNLQEFAKDFAMGRTADGVTYKVVGIGKHEDSHDYYGFLYVLQARDGKTYIMHNGYVGKPETKSLELTETPKPVPKFKPGDKVVPVSKSVWYIGNSEPNCSSWKNGKFQKEYLTVMTMESSTINYLRGNITGGQIYRCDGDYYLESDLIPYVEPPKFKKGDKVVPIAISWFGWDFDEYINYNANIPRFLKENGYLCVSAVKDEEYQYRCGTDNMKGQDRFKESELIPYVEPKPEPKKVPAFKVGDRVRVKADLKVGEYYNELPLLDTMKKDYGGKATTVNDVKEEAPHGFIYFLNGFGGFGWSESMLELFPLNHCPENKTVTESGATFIFRDNVTICILKAGERQFKGVAKCAPEDTWDESVGESWAYLRAMRKLLNALEKNLRIK